MMEIYQGLLAIPALAPFAIMFFLFARGLLLSGAIGVTLLLSL